MTGNCSIIIRAYNEEKYLGHLLEGIQQQTIKDAEILLVDSGSTDGTVSVAASFGARIVRIPSGEFTFGRSLNLGIQNATRELIVMASAHVYPVYPDWLKSLLRPFGDKNVALTYGKQRGPESAKFSEQQIYQHWYPDVSQLHQATAFCNNANAAIRRRLWQKNPYDETLTGLEDLAGENGRRSRVMTSPTWQKRRLSISIMKRQLAFSTVTGVRGWRSKGFIQKHISATTTLCVLQP